MSKRIVLNIFIPIIVMVYLGWNYSYLAYLYGIILISAVFFTLMLGLFGDKKFTIKELSGSIILLIVAASIFGKYVYGNMPRGFGGGCPSETTVLFNNKGKEFVRQYRFHTIDTLAKSHVSLLYTSSDKYLLKYDSLTISLDKSLIDGFVLSTPNIQDSSANVKIMNSTVVDTLNKLPPNQALKPTE